MCQPVCVVCSVLSPLPCAISRQQEPSERWRSKPSISVPQECPGAQSLCRHIFWEELWNLFTTKSHPGGHIAELRQHHCALLSQLGGRSLQQSFLLISISGGLQRRFWKHRFGFLWPHSTWSFKPNCWWNKSGPARWVTVSYLLIYFRVWNILKLNHDNCYWFKSASSVREKEKKNMARLSFCSNFQNS